MVAKQESIFILAEDIPVAKLWWDAGPCPSIGVRCGNPPFSTTVDLLSPLLEMTGGRSATLGGGTKMGDLVVGGVMLTARRGDWEGLLGGAGERWDRVGGARGV